ncbi:OLC1v1000560C1 [Oldenlandia corymbosa var. corymbosa]|uniref:OLC1v1000560C1 n=1 Tax=Oldenlandia corymbosa var. corymbosa TaxID=529605 RepID=A0AAV1D5Y2_OLDCO|nr:OLC1v1000560C1 [Oldenlandia corymbosa var. corymbosa]
MDSSGDHSPNWNAYFFVSPYARTKSTAQGICGEIIQDICREKCGENCQGICWSVLSERVVGIKEECRIREQDFANFQTKGEISGIRTARNNYGTFFFRYPKGESPADIYDRISTFLKTLWRDIDMKRLSSDPSSPELSIVIVSNGTTIRVFLTRWFKWSAEQYNELWETGNCEIRVMTKGPIGEYSLAFEHDEETMKRWGLFEDTIKDQIHRKDAKPGEYVWKENSETYIENFLSRT